MRHSVTDYREQEAFKTQSVSKDCLPWLARQGPIITTTNITEFQRRRGPVRAVGDGIWKRQTG